jgi:hypothetical protein
MNRFGAVCVALSAAYCGVTSALHAAVIAIGALKDNTLYEDANGALSNGSGQRFFVGRAGGGAVRRGVLEFDIAGSVPAGSTINSVSLRLNMSNTSAGPTVVELRAALAEWGEGASVAGGGEGGGAASAPGDATWIHTFYNTNFWSAAGGDYSGVTSASLTVGGLGFYTWSSAQLTADVQSWLDSPASNHGWIMLGDETFAGSAKRFDTRENSVAANRPLLTIDYTPVPEPSGLGLPILLALMIRRSGRLY